MGLFGVDSDALHIEDTAKHFNIRIEFHTLATQPGEGFRIDQIGQASTLRALGALLAGFPGLLPWGFGFRIRDFVHILEIVLFRRREVDGLLNDGNEPLRRLFRFRLLPGRQVEGVFASRIVIRLTRHWMS